MIPVVEIQTWNDLSLQFERLDAHRTPWMFRGQSRFDWELTPALLRELAPLLNSQAEMFPPSVQQQQVIDLECDLIRKFKSLAHHYLSMPLLATFNSSENDIAWLTLMQHHGVPTRLLDWSESLFVAVYFASIDDLEHDGAVWCVNRNWLGTHSYQLGVTPAPFGFEDGQLAKFASSLKPTLKTFLNPFPSDRMISQQGLFSVSGDPLSYHSAIIAEHYDGSHQESEEMIAVKLRLHKDAKKSILQKLRRMNISARTLFPGLDGLARGIKEELRIRDTADPPWCI